MEGLAQTRERFVPYNELMIQDFEDMQRVVHRRMREAEDAMRDGNETAAVESLRNALKLVLSRPDADNAAGRLTRPLRTALQQLNAYEDSVNSLTAEGLTSLQNPRLPVEMRSTYVFMLENIMSEMRPHLGHRPEAREVFERIRDAKIKMPKDVIQNRQMVGMFRTPDLSATARQVLEQAFPDEAPPPRRGFFQRLFGRSDKPSAAPGSSPKAGADSDSSLDNDPSSLLPDAASGMPELPKPPPAVRPVDPHWDSDDLFKDEEPEGL